MAVAGAGKSTTAVGAAKVAKGKVGFVAFNKHIADHLQQKLGSSASACTLHSLGFRAVSRAFPKAELDEGKAKKLLRQLRPGWFFETRRGWQAREEAQGVLALARLAKLTLTPEGDKDRLTELVEHYNVELAGGPLAAYGAVGELITESVKDVQSVDFDDMVWLPVRLGLTAGDFDLLMVDEAQDLNRCQQELVRSASPDGRLVVIGDPRQSIMGFTGADTESFPRLGRQLGEHTRGVRECPLTVTFRCPASHVALAQRVVPAIQAAPGAVDGVVRCCTNDELRAWLRPDDLVVCRKNAPVLGLAYRLITAGVPAVMRGRDVGKGLLELIDRLRPRDCADLIEELEIYRERETARLGRRDAPQSAHDALEDRCTSLGQLASQCATLQRLRDFIGGLFTDNDSTEGKVVLSSVHRAKGLEADRVAILAPDCLPMVRRDSKPWEIEQEMNLLYVAVTRAKRELVFVGEMPSVLR